MRSNISLVIEASEYRSPKGNIAPHWRHIRVASPSNKVVSRAGARVSCALYKDRAKAASRLVAFLWSKTQYLVVFQAGVSSGLNYRKKVRKFPKKIKKTC